MSVQLLEVGSQTAHLSLCRLSLILGVYTPENKIESFLKFACSILHVEKGILAFKDEPYIWHYSRGVFKASYANENINFDCYFGNDPIVQIGHPNFEALSHCLKSLGIAHERLIAISIRDKQKSIGHVFLFDDLLQTFQEDNIVPVSEFVQSLVYILQVYKENMELKELYDEQKILNSSSNKYLQIIAHDLRAPFHGLLGFTDVLLHERSSLSEQEVDGILKYLDDTAQSTYRLLERLLGWAMADGGRFKYHPINFNLSEATKVVMGVLKGFAQKKDIQLLDQCRSDVRVFADFNMVTSVIQNLVSNALKFSPSDGSAVVSIFSEMEGEKVHIYVRDTGLGMSEHQIKHLFDPQFALSLLGTQGEVGTGLGLVLCKRFIDLNLGEITVTSKASEGTTFKVTLPSPTYQPMHSLPELLKL